MFFVLWISILHYILNIKMTSQSLPNFCIELRAVGSVKFDNDCDVILLFNIFTFNPIRTLGGGGCFPQVLLFACNFLFLSQFPSNLIPFLKFIIELGEKLKFLKFLSRVTWHDYI